jgi:hypothetical protein
MRLNGYFTPFPRMISREKRVEVLSTFGGGREEGKF